MVEIEDMIDCTTITVVTDVSADLWELVACVNSIAIDAVAKTAVFRRFRDLIDRGDACMVSDACAIPFDRVLDLADLNSLFSSLRVVGVSRGRDCYVFRDVDTLFKGMAAMFAAYADSADPRRSAIHTCMQKMVFSVDVNEMALDIGAMSL